MLRAHRCCLPGHVWHITHRCYRNAFLLEFAGDRERWLYWMHQAGKHYGLCVLNYVITSNHVHLLVQDQGNGEVAQSMRLVAARTSREYNQRQGRRAAYWEDRYHATAVETGEYLRRCMTYIDCHMVRAGVVRHPEDWIWSGYYEIQYPPGRYRVVDTKRLLELNGVRSEDNYRDMRRACVDNQGRSGFAERDSVWSESLAVGSSAYVDRVRAALSRSVRGRRMETAAGVRVLHAPSIGCTPVSGF